MYAGELVCLLEHRGVETLEFDDINGGLNLEKFGDLVSRLEVES